MAKLHGTSNGGAGCVAIQGTTALLFKASWSLKTNFKIKMFNFRGLIDSSEQNEQFHAPLLFKIQVLIDMWKENCGTISPFRFFPLFS